MCKRRRRRGWNGGRRLWKREAEKSRAKWWKRKPARSPRRVRQRPRRVTSRESLTTTQRRTGGKRRGRKKWRKRNQIKSQLSRRRRRGTLSPKRKRTSGVNFLGSRREERRGDMERRRPRRRFRAGRVGTVVEGKRRRQRGAVEYWRWGSSKAMFLSEKQRIGSSVSSQGNLLMVKSPESERAHVGRRIREEYWEKRKLERIQSQYFRGNRRRNGRTARGYRRVNYQMGARVVKRRPRQGERRVPQGMRRRR